MYRFRGGFINTIKQYSDNHILNNLLLANPNTYIVNIKQKYETEYYIWKNQKIE